LLPQRLVEAVGGREIFLRLGRERIGALGHGIEGAARRGVHHQEGDEGHREERRDQPEKPLEGEKEHRASLITRGPGAPKGSWGAATIGKALGEVKGEVVSSKRWRRWRSPFFPPGALSRSMRA